MNRKNFFIVIPLVALAAYALFRGFLEGVPIIVGIVRIIASWLS